MANVIRVGGGGGGSSTLITKSITQNGTYLAQDDNADGYSEVEVDVSGREVDKVYFQNTFSRGATPLTLTLLETANKTSHIKLTGSVWAPSIPTGYTATTGTISDNSFTTTETSEYHWDYVQEFDITCGNDNAVIVYNGELNQASEVSLNVYHIYNLAPKTITQNGIYRASDDGVDSYNSVTVNVSGGGASKQISYLKWHITNTRSNPEGSAVQLSEFYLYLDNVLYNWSSNVSITASLPPYSAGESIEHIIDGSVDTKYVTTQWGGSSVGQCDIVISLGETIKVDNNTSYAYATGNDVPTRDPVGWTLFGSLDGSSWFRLDVRGSANVPTERKTSTEKFSISVGGGGGIDYLESWIINSKSAVNTPTTTTHLVYTNGSISTFENADNAGNETVTLGDISTFIGDASSYYWWVTANANMTYRIYNVLTGTLGELQTATSGTRIISDGAIDTNYCMEIRRYS